MSNIQTSFVTVEWFFSSIIFKSWKVTILNLSSASVSVWTPDFQSSSMTVLVLNIKPQICFTISISITVKVNRNLIRSRVSNNKLDFISTVIIISDSISYNISINVFDFLTEDSSSEGITTFN